MRILERPSPVLVTLVRHQVDRLGDARVWRGPRSAQVVEPPQNVVVPARGKRTLRPRRGPLELPIDGDNLSGRSRSEQAALEEIFLSAKASAGDVRPWTLRLSYSSSPSSTQIVVWNDDRWLRGASQFQPPSLNCS
jgi:hypothetical protein